MKVGGPIREANPCVFSHFAAAPPQVGWNPCTNAASRAPVWWDGTSLYRHKIALSYGGRHPGTNVVGYASGITSGGSRSVSHQGEGAPFLHQ